MRALLAVWCPLVASFRIENPPRQGRFTKREVIDMFKFLNVREQLLEEKRKNEALQALVKDLENALIEVAKIAAINAEVLNG